MTIELAPTTARRGFLGRCLAALAGAAVAPRTLGALAPEPSQGRAPDERWLAGLTGRHKQIFEMSAVRDGVGLARVLNFLDTYRAAYGLGDAQVNALYGAHSAGIVLLLADALWAKHQIGQRFNILDPLTRAPATRNPYVRKHPQYQWPVDYSIDALQRRGVRFLGCGRSFNALATTLAGGGSASALEAELLAGVLPGVYVVPAMVVAINRAQESGITYCAVG